MKQVANSPRHTEYGVQPFAFQKRQLAPQPLRSASGADQALRLGERLAASNAGVLVYSRRIAAENGEYEDVKVLATHGELPAELLEQLAA